MRLVTVGSLTLLVAVVAAACCALAPARAVDWPEPPWSPTMGMAVKLSSIRLDKVDLLTALVTLCDQCGLTFGYIDLTPDKHSVGPISVDLQDVTVRQVVAEIQRQSPGYVFEVVDDVVIAAPRDPAGIATGLLSQVVVKFEVRDATRDQVGWAVAKAIRSLKGAPPEVEDVGEMGLMPLREGRRSTIRLANVPFEELAAKVAAQTWDSWVLTLEGDRRAFFAMGQNLAYPCVLAGRVQVVRDPDAPRQPTRGGVPDTAVVVQRVDAAVRRLWAADNDLGSAVREMTDLLDDEFGRYFAGTKLADGVRLLGALRAKEAVPALIRNLAFTTNYDARRFPGWVSHFYMDHSPPKIPEGAKPAYDDWMKDFPCAGALVRIGQPSVTPLTAALAELDLKVPADARQPDRQAEELECRFVLLCGTLSQILGTDGAMAALREAAATEKDPTKATRLRDAAYRTSIGVPPVPAPAQK